MSTEIATATTNQLPAYLQAEELNGLGNENVTTNDLATPYLSLLQGLSEQCTMGKPGFIPEARPGQFYNSVTKELSTSLLVVNMFFDTVYAANKKRKLGQDYQGDHASEADAIEHLRLQGLNPADYDINEVAKHTLALMDKDGNIQGAAIFSFRNTALRIGKQWNSQILTTGKNAPRFSLVWELSSGIDSNDKGTWAAPVVSFKGFVKEQTLGELVKKYKEWRGVKNAT